MFLFTACLFMHSVCTICSFPLFPLAPCGPWFDWPLIHADLLEISFNPMCLGRKMSERSHVCSVPGSWAAGECSGRRSPPPKKPILIPPHSQGCRRRHGFTSGGHPLPQGPGEPLMLHTSTRCPTRSHERQQWQRLLQPQLHFGATFVNCFSSSAYANGILA